MIEKNATIPKHSRWTVAAIVLACVPLVVLGLCAIAAILGVKDSQGIIYAFALPIGAAVIAWPMALICLAVGIARDAKQRTPGRRGMWMNVIGVTAILLGLFVLSRLFGFH